MANSRVSENGKELAIIDTAPGADGYWTNPVRMRKLRGQSLNKMFFSVRNKTSTPTTATPTLQFKGTEEDVWTDYYNDGNDFSVGDNKLIENNALDISWRAGVKNGDYSGGAMVIGFNW